MPHNTLGKPSDKLLKSEKRAAEGCFKKGLGLSIGPERMVGKKAM
jgi:hypothetical protein